MFNNPSRRHMLTGAAMLAGSTMMPRAWAATSGSDPRLVVMLLRGGLDGLAAVLPAGDPSFAEMRADFTPGSMPPLPLDGFFQLNGNLRTIGALYQTSEALVFHAIATPYRSRSHFDAQEVLESGLPRSGIGATTGWLNRALSVVPMISGETLGRSALAVAATTPLILRGPARVESWQPQVLPYANADLSERLVALYDSRDPALAAALKTGIGVDDYLSGSAAMLLGKAAPVALPAGFPSAAASLASLMRRADGPRIAVLNYDGWDTHALEGAYEGRLAVQLSALDAAVAALQAGLGPLWRDTAIIIVSEFGRTVRVNGTRGTDHGTAGVAFLVGGAVAGGRVIADWPGMSTASLYEGRDLNPTADLRSPLKGLLRDHLRLSEETLSETVFPQSKSVKPMQGLLRS